MAGLVMRDWPRCREWLGIVIGLAGVVLLVFDGEVRGNPGATLMQYAALTSWALGGALSRKQAIAPGTMGSASEMLVAGVLLLAISLLRGEALLLTVSAAAWASWAYLALQAQCLHLRHTCML